MNIIIVGGGLVGSTLGAKLSGDGYDVTLIEQDASKIRELAERADVQVIEGNGATAPMLLRAGVEEAGLLVATTDSDEANMVVGMLATSRFHVPRVVVRLRDPDHAEGFALISRGQTGEHVRVNPDAAAVDRIFSLLEVSGAVDVVTFMVGRLLVAGFRIGAGSKTARRLRLIYVGITAGLEVFTLLVLLSPQFWRRFRMVEHGFDATSA